MVITSSSLDVARLLLESKSYSLCAKVLGVDKNSTPAELHQKWILEYNKSKQRKS